MKIRFKNPRRKRAKASPPLPLRTVQLKRKKAAPEPVPASHAPRVLNQENHDPTKQLPTRELVTRVVALAQTLCEKRFYPYQIELVSRIIESVLEHDGEVITSLMSRQAGKCLAKGTKVMRYSGQITDVENIKEGDLLMGDDNTPRKVLSVCSGVGQLYTIKPRCNYADPYTVNDAHILSVIQRGTKSRKQKDRVFDISISDYFDLPKSVKADRILGYKVPVSFKHRKIKPIIDPYWFGLWLGDGGSADTRITTGDGEIAQFIEDYADKLDCKMSNYSEKGNCVSLAIVKKKHNSRTKSKIHRCLFEMGVLGRKHIPMHFLVNSRKVRLEVLAGLIDSDGYVEDGRVEITQVNKQLAAEIQHLARSLGFRASMREKSCRCQTGATSIAWRVCLYGELWEIPTRVERKKIKKSVLRENPRTYGFDVVDAGVGEYFGFVLDGNKRFLLGDFTVTHNTQCLGAISAAMAIIFPMLAKQHPLDWKLNITDDKGVYRGYAFGISIGIYAPKLEQASIMFDRTKQSLETDTAKKVLGQLGLTLVVKNGNTLRFTNGSRVLCESASEQAKIEGATHNVLIIEEAQDVSDQKCRKSLHPMIASTMGTIIKIGTASTHKCDFYSSIQLNKRTELITGKRNHFFYPYTVGEKYNSMYGKYIAKEKIRLGEDSDEFRTSYSGEWIFERGMFITQEQLFDRDIAQTEGLFSLTYEGGFMPRILRPYSIVAGIDWGSSSDSTVVTLVAVDWNNPIESGSSYSIDGDHSYTFYRKHIINWLEFIGDNYEHQFWEITQFLARYPALAKIVTDSNTCGKPIYDRLYAHYAQSQVEVEPFNFQAKTKSDGYKSLYGDICAKRTTFPASDIVRRDIRYRKFVNQMLDLRKEYNNGLMSVAHPPEKGARDDFSDSLMMSNWGANVPAYGKQLDFLDKNPFYN